MKIGDKFKITDHIKYNCGLTKTIAKVNAEKRESASLLEREFEVLNVKEKLVFFEEPDASEYEKKTPYVTTLTELERIGINTKTEKMITGYKLLKDLPNLPKDTLFIWYEENECWSNSHEEDAYWYKKEEIESLTKWFEPIYEEEFKVGDYIVLTKNPSGWAHSTPIGTMFKIAKDKTEYSGGEMFTVSDLEDKLRGGLDDGHFRKATEKEIKEATTFKVGDFVIVTSIDTYSYGKSCGEARPKVGKMYKVVEGGASGYTYLYIGQYSKIAIKAEGLRKATSKEIERFSVVEIGKYKAEIIEQEVKFGCQTLTRNDLITVKKLLNEEINASISIHGTTIDNALINKIIGQLG